MLHSGNEARRNGSRQTGTSLWTHSEWQVDTKGKRITGVVEGQLDRVDLRCSHQLIPIHASQIER